MSSDPEVEPSLPLEFAWPLAVAAGAAGSLVGLFVGWPAFSAAFAAVGLWVVERRSRLEGRHFDTALVTLGWLVAVVLTTGDWALGAESEAVERAFPGFEALADLVTQQPWLVAAGAILISLVAAFGARWADGSFAYWVWALAAGYLAVVPSIGRELAAEGGEILFVVQAIPSGPTLALTVGVFVRALRDSGNRRYAWAALVALTAALAGTVLR